MYIVTLPDKVVKSDVSTVYGRLWVDVQVEIPSGLMVPEEKQKEIERRVNALVAELLEKP